MSTDRPFLGIMFMISFCVIAPLGDALAKVLGETIPLGQLVLTRFAVQTAALLPLAYFTGRSLWMSRRVFRLTVVRSFLHIIGIGAMFSSLRFLPLADAVAIAFVMPFIMLLLGKYVLQEEVGLRRLLACVVGFIGTLLVIQPSFAAVGVPALLPLLVAVVFALFMLVTRQIAKDVDPISMQAVSGMVATGALGLMYLIPGTATLAQFQFVMPEGAGIWSMLLAIGLLGTFAHLMMTWSLRYAPSATVAPVQYLEIPIATLMGFAVFGDWPNGLAMLGIGITMAAGLYILMRERRMSKLIPPAA
ncbi:DMT family transporter [uncultured Litoreibacter sp.]|uniref:DMT family transporter n=1 Tax=uncultured Litoreibacter sp. TaxID=1392394 RepID=UPI002637FBFA|nr:DMT family transporter [uncultured Litoreibacter sp.]